MICSTASASIASPTRSNIRPMFGSFSTEPPRGASCSMLFPSLIVRICEVAFLTDLAAAAKGHN